MRKFLFFFHIVFPLLLFAQQQKKENKLIETGQFSKQKRSELADVTRIITESEIRLRGANNLKDILIMETGGIFSYDELKGWQFKWHGSSKGNILVLIDGLPFRSGQFDENDMQQIPLDNVSRIEIVENPEGVSYGPSAIMTVINVVSKSTQEKVYKPSLRFQSYNPGGIYTNLTLGRRTTENFFRFSSSVDAFAGVQGNDSSRVLQWLPYTRLNNQIYFSHKILQYMDISVGFNNMYEQKTQLGYPYPQTVRAYDREIKTNNNTLTAGLKGKLTRFYSLQGELQLMNYSRKNSLFLKDISNSEQMAVNDTSLNDTIIYNYVFSRWVLTEENKNKKLNYQMGFDLASTADRFKPKVNNIAQIITTTSLFGRVKYKPINELRMDAGFRLPYSSQYKTKALWDIKINYKFTSLVHFKFMIARSTKAPTFDQMFATYLTNGYSIKRNLNLTDESAMSYHYSLYYKVDNLFIEPGFFSYNFKDGIELVADKTTPSRLVHNNIIEKKIIGTRVNAEYSSKYVDLNIRMCLTSNNHFANLYDRSFFYSEIYSNLTFKIPNLDFNVCYINKFTSNRGYMGLDPIQGPLTYFNNNFNLGDVVIEKFFSKKTIIIRGGVKNIFNVVNINSYTLPIDITGTEIPNRFVTPLLQGINYFFELHINL